MYTPSAADCASTYTKIAQYPTPTSTSLFKLYAISSSTAICLNYALLF